MFLLLVAAIGAAFETVRVLLCKSAASAALAREGVTGTRVQAAALQMAGHPAVTFTGFRKAQAVTGTALVGRGLLGPPFDISVRPLVQGWPAP